MSTAPTPALFAQRYHITNRLGDSSTASVHRAKDVRLQRSVLLHVQHSTTPRAMQPHGGLRGLLRVYDSGVLDGRAYVITEAVSGQTLADMVPLTPLQALTVVRAVTATVIEAQAQAVPLPPITSRNVWLFDHDRVVLVDDWHLPAGERAQLEAAYHAPEVKQGMLTPVGMVYALGVLLRETLTGSATTNRAAHVPLQLARILDRATATHAQQRFPTPNAFTQALDQYAASIDTPTMHMPSAQPVPGPPAQPATTPVARPAPRPQPAPVPPPRQTKVMAGPPPLINTPAAASAGAAPSAQAVVQRVRGWQMPRVHAGPWQRRLMRRGWWLAQRVVLIGLILIGLNFAYNAISARARSINVGQWIDANAPQFDLGQWIDQNMPNINLPDVNVGEWAQQQADDIRDTVSNQIDNFGTSTTYRVTQQINLRSDPSAASADTIIAQLPAGTRIQQSGTSQPDANGNAYEWIRVTVLDGDQTQEGWVAMLTDRIERE